MQFNINVIVVCIIIEQALCNILQKSTNDVSTKTTVQLDCSRFTDDLEIVNALPFRTYIGSMVHDRTYALMDTTNHNIHTLQISKETYFPGNVFCLKNLRTLIIDSTPFNYGNDNYDTGVMPDGLGNLKLLNTLNIKNTKIHKMSDSLGNLTALTTLTLSNCGLMSLPNLSKLISLTSLTIDSNPITSLIGLQRVGTLDLHNCQFSSIPVMATPTTLTTLNMRNNRVSQIVNLYLYTSLRTVDFDGNRINQVLPSIVKLIYLDTLILSNNELWYLPNEITQLVYLKTLNIANNTFSPTEIQIIKDKFKPRLAVKLII